MAYCIIHQTENHVVGTVDLSKIITITGKHSQDESPRTIKKIPKVFNVSRLN